MTNKGGLISSKGLACIDAFWEMAFGAPRDKDRAKLLFWLKGGRHFDPSTGRVNVSQAKFRRFLTRDNR